MELKSKDYSNKKMIKSILTLLDKPKPGRAAISLAWQKAKKLDPNLKGKKDWDNFHSIAGRDRYVTKLMKLQTERSNTKVAMIELEKMRKNMKESSETIEATKVKIEKIDKIRKRPVYTVRFRILTLTEENNLEKVALDDGET